MYFPNILSLLSVCILTHYANSEENLHIDDSKFGSLELPNSPKKFTVAQQVTYFRDIKSISNVIQNVQKRMEDEYTMQASLTTNSKHSNKELEFKSLVSSFLQAEFFSSENNSLPLFPELTFNCTADYCGHDDTERVNCTNSVLLNQTDTSVEIVYSQSSLDDILKFDPNIIDWNTSALCTLVLFYDSSCELSILAAPHFNIFPRIFPQIKMVAFNIANMIQKTKENLRELPTLALYHNGELFADYQDIEYTIQTFTEFVMYYTGM
ncbi:Thioredoxin-like fold [Cinara cedri]|uniref:Thioredoxin-like fold n=1 Tax=Cinara cedri TaxID=506608 RepID=A0A5E4NT21_9HEMI|nr:Thioredoxin-like fold [Cinara cedri]